MTSETDAARWASGLIAALHVGGPAGEHAGKLMLIGRFVGSWHLKWSGTDIDGQLTDRSGDMCDIRGAAVGSAAARLAIGRGRALSWSLALLPAALLV